MLDQETKRRIDSCRDILVGKVPDPKSQVEQITIALIYKFMDDMDKESEEWGGKATFFTCDYEKYTWSKIFDPRLGGFDLIQLYGDAIVKMNQNPNIPQLFRDIFKNAYLPYRDPETLKSFLKEINGFTYDHSERLGDAFEYLLSVMDSQGDAGQFRTPRHIIDFIVEIVSPKKNETVLDPACGTAGFLISSYKHILKANTSSHYPLAPIGVPDGKRGDPVKRDRGVLGDQLTTDEKVRLINNFTGYDISPDMVRLSLVNLYLHGFSNPKIHEYDTLTSEEKWSETADVMLANPPFMTPKGGIRPHKRFSVQAKRSEVLFVDYIAEHLNPGGRAGVIVPEGIIFQSSYAYKALRKMLVEDYLWAVVSLPAGVFQPYSGVKTSILLMNKAKAKQIDSILFVKVENDGFDLGARRRPIDKNDLPEALKILHNPSVIACLDGRQASETTQSLAHYVAKSKIAESSDWNLSGERYKDNGIQILSDFNFKPVGELLDIQSGFAFKSKLFNEDRGFQIIRIRNIKTGFTNTLYDGEYEDEFVVNDGDLLIGMDGEFNATIWNGGQALLNQRVCRLHNFKGCLKEYVFRMIQRKLKEVEDITYAVTVKHISTKQIKDIEIPLPPLSVQEEIVAEIDGYQKIIDGARQVIDNYKPIIPPSLIYGRAGKIDPEWEMVALGEVCEINPKKSEVKEIPDNTLVSFVPMAILNEHNMKFHPEEEKPISSVFSGYTYFKDDDVLLARVTPCFENGKAGIAENLKNGIGFGSSEYLIIRPNEKILSVYIYLLVTSNSFRTIGINKMTGTGGLQRVPKDYVVGYKIPFPPLSIQQEIVTQIEAEQEMVNANKKLIEIFKQKIKNKIGEVWGE